MSQTPDFSNADDRDAEDLARDRELFLEAMSGREFTLADVIAQAGGNFLKGESPIPKLVQIKNELKLFISQNLHDLSGSLQAILQIEVDQADKAISHHLDQPLLVLEELVEQSLNQPETFYELVKQVDFKYGQMYEERPHFQRPGAPAHPDDEYSHESVRVQLTNFLERIENTLERLFRTLVIIKYYPRFLTNLQSDQWVKTTKKP